MRMTDDETLVATEVRVAPPCHRRALQMWACIKIGMDVSPASHEKNGVAVVFASSKSWRIPLSHFALMAKPLTHRMTAQWAAAPAGGGPPGAHFSRAWKRNSWEASALM